MEYFLSHLYQEIARKIAQAIDTTATVVVQPGNPKLGSDLAVPCFAMAKEKQQSPQEMAARATTNFTHPAVLRAEAVGGFLNLWLKPEVLATALQSDMTATNQHHLQFGEHTTGKGQTVIVEFPSANVAKPFGVGHLRPATQGWAISQLMRAMGFTVVTDDHLGDWGTPFGKWAEGYKRYSSEAQIAADGVYELARVYIQITKDLKQETAEGGHELADKVQAWLLKLENSDPEATELSERFTKLSLAHIHAVKKRLKITTDFELGESFYIPEAKKMTKEMLEKGIAVQNPDGTVIIPLDEYGIETPVLIQKSNGTALYATTDMATLRYRWEKWHPAKVFHLVGGEQQFHFKQIFALADKLGYGKPEYQHIWWGMIDQLDEDGKRSKMSSRKGVVLLDELLDRAEEQARQLVKESGNQVSDQDIQKIALGAVKFTDFAADRHTGILFDWQRIFALQGFSGPYVQYAGVRIAAIINKFGLVQDKPSDTTYDWQAEKDLLLHLHAYPRIVAEAASSYEAHKIAQFAYDLARILNRYYETTSIADSESALQQQRLWLLAKVKDVHAHALGLLGIEVPHKM